MRKYKTLADNPVFMTIYDMEKDLNEHIDITRGTNISQYLKDTLFFYHNADGSIGSITLHTVYYQTVEKHLKRKGKSWNSTALARDNNRFMEIYNAFPDLNKHLDLSTLKANDTHEKLHYIAANGVPRSPRVYYVCHGAYTRCFSEHGLANIKAGAFLRSTKNMSLAEYDPELLKFAGENADLIYTLSANYKGVLTWICPYCAHKFSRTPPNIARKHPKCPRCKDTGIYDTTNDDYFPVGYTMRSPATRKALTFHE